MGLDLDDRLSFGEGPLGEPVPEEEEEAPTGGRSNRAFIFLAIAMGGLILLGILALVGAMAFIVPRQKSQRATAIAETVAAATMQAAAWTPTFTPSPTTLPTWTPTVPPTWTPIPSPTATRVVNQTPTPLQATPTPTRSTIDEWGGQTPSTGLGGLGIVAVAAGLAGLVFAVRKIRT